MLGSPKGAQGVTKNVRMVDSTTQTSDELLESLLMEKLHLAYENRQREIARESAPELGFKKVWLIT